MKGGNKLFDKKIVVITGAANGIGKVIATMYARQNTYIVLADIDEENGENLCTELGENSLFIQCDVRSEKDVLSLFKKVHKKFGRMDILINNAGKMKHISPLDLSLDDWDDVMNTNVRSVFLCSREAAKLMKLSGGGSIISLASTRAFMSEPHTESYAASKGAIVALTHALASSLGPDNITVNCISPGWIETGDYTTLRTIDHAQHFSNRVGIPEDIARACLFLSSPDNNFITGTNMTIDGGMTKKMIYEP